jgi:hypothetical protein
MTSNSCTEPQTDIAEAISGELEHWIFVLSTCQMSASSLSLIHLSIKIGSHFLGTTDRYRGHLSWKKRFKISGAFGTDGGKKVLRRLDFWSVIS